MTALLGLADSLRAGGNLVETQEADLPQATTRCASLGWSEWEERFMTSEREARDG